MKTIIQPEDWETALSQWRGGEVVVWMYHAGHRLMAIRLSHSEMSEDLYVVGVGCQQIQGPFAWGPSALMVLAGDSAREAGSSEDGLILDAAAGFRLCCRDVVLVRGPRGGYDVSFEGFLGEQEDA
ncbi:hypothetical protein HUA74_32785 [Myxococcus sp. CA051A]|uniref:hypothetical protein n=1 Tax=unclassified Myxococcus TaxID=2648731 RepID=UPI00157B47E2|nr:MULTISPECIES: hypothetical protein [unclassified Myxococcus]NTX00188.1 hypothetical protein [Myxococcus sp. CA040A]NTX53215.1 hypothetical protein [Myxococcus sp. CA039A]NTX65446.1 hypothetical protein [Myxococcus sp. CA051A]